MHSGVSAQRFVRFALVGVFATLIHYTLLVILVELCALGPTVSSTIGFIISTPINYRLNYTLTFKSGAAHESAFPKFILTALLGLLVNAAVVFLLTEMSGVYYLVAQIIATAVTLVWNYTMNEIWSFRP